MPTFTVEWSIEWDAETPQQAAREVWENFFKPDHDASYFTVFKEAGNTHEQNFVNAKED